MAWSVVDLPTHGDHRGLLTVVNAAGLPVAFTRVFWCHGVPPGVLRGLHAHREQHQGLVCLHGAVDCHLDDGTSQGIVRLDSPQRLLHIPPMTWGGQVVVDPGSLYLVFASGPYDRAEYLDTREAWQDALKSLHGT